jgi:uracil-DNA glycosylase
MLTRPPRSRHTPLHQVKAVIVGQDPYHNHNQAHGLAFSVRPPTPAPPSLANMYKGIKNDYPSFEPPPNKGGLLTPWAERGVLMLNTCLTVRAHQANSHSNKGWERFTQKALDTVARVRTRGVVFLAWGTPAGKRVAGINRQKHCVLQSVHPSPLSAMRGFVCFGLVSSFFCLAIFVVCCNGLANQCATSLIMAISRSAMTGFRSDTAQTRSSTGI